MKEPSSTCNGCYWRDSCDYSSPCEYYYSPGMESSDAAVMEFIEEKREEFRREWHEYIRDFE